MPYTTEELEEIARDPVRLHAWWWHIAKHNERLARQKRTQSRHTGVQHSIKDYHPRYDEGAELIQHAELSERVAVTVLEHIEALTRSTLEPARCTCRPSSPNI